jgi:pimeloyl-ACP methyl ester carboxylesterase
MDDVRAVLDALGSQRAALLGHSEGGSMSMLFAATYPDRTSALVLVGVFAKRICSDDYPWAPSPGERAATIEEVGREWVSEADLDHYAPSEDAAFRGHLQRFIRQSASPGAAQALLEMNSQIDTRSILPTIRVPTAVIHRTHDRDVTVEEGRWIAEEIPGRAVRRASGPGSHPVGRRPGRAAGRDRGVPDGRAARLSSRSSSLDARVASAAGSGEVLVSQTVKDLVAGSGIEFAERGTHELKGVPGEWRLYAVVDA